MPTYEPASSRLEDKTTESFLQDQRIESPIVTPPLPKEYLEPSFLYGAYSVCKVLGGLFFFLWLTPWAVSRLGYVALLILAPWVGASIYKVSIVLHDCIHGTLFSSRVMNRGVGYLCGGLLATHFRTFQHNHWEHHRLYGRSGDPQGSDYLGLQGASRGTILLHLLRPLWGFNLFKLVLLNRSSAKILEMDSRITPIHIPLYQKLLHAALIVLTQALIFWIVTQGGTYKELFLFYPACAATFGLFFSQLRGFCEHNAFPNAVHEIFVRTHIPNFIDQLFFYDLNFNFHVEHHLYPSVPSFRLATIFERIKKTHHSAHTVSPSIYRTLRSRLSVAR